MPAEKAYGTQLIPVNEQGGSPAVPIVEVRWSRDAQYVQVVTKATDPHDGRLASEDPGVHYTDGFFVDLDRVEINRLIRHLRRARDQAFGRDE